MLVSSAKSRRSWSPRWKIPRSSSFAKPRPRNNAQIVICIGKMAFVYCSCGRCQTPSKSTEKLDKKNFDALSIPGYVVKTKRTYTEVPNMELPNGNQFATKPSSRCRKLANPSMVGTKPSWKDGTTRTNTASLCQKLGGLAKQIIQYDALALEHHSYIATRGGRNEKKLVLKLNEEGAQGPMNQRPDFVEAKREMKKTAWWTCERDFRRKHTHSSCTTIKTAKGPPIWRTWRVYLSNRRPNRMENLSFEVTGKLVAESNTFVLVKSMGGWSEVEQKLEFLAILILDWTVVISQFRDNFFFCRLSESEFPGNRRGCGQVHLPRATFTRVQSLHRTHSTDDMCTMAQRAGRLKGFLCTKIGHSSTRHVCFFAARDTEHFLTFSFFYLSCVVVVFFSEPRPVVHVSNYPLRRSIAGWHLYGIHLLHRFWAQRDRVQQDSGQTTKSKNWRPGWYWRTLCEKVVLQSISLRFGRKHCDAARLGPRRRAIT